VRSQVELLAEHVSKVVSASEAAQQRMEAWHLTASQARKQVARHAPCVESASLTQKQQRYIFFERDMAGFNNIRLQLQSMVAIAALTGRALALPPPGRIDHVKDPYFEFDFFDPAKLAKVVPVALHKQPDNSTLRVAQDLSQVDLRQLDEDRDWLFPMQSSRIQHFECLNLNTRDRAVAAHAVLHGVAFDQKFEQMASTDLSQLGLADKGEGKEGQGGGKNFNCVHVRRGDFKKFAPQFWMEDDQLSTKLQGLLAGSDRPVLVTSDAHPQLSLGARVVHASDAYDASSTDQTRLAVDMIMCSRAKDFVGSPLSTFTNGILELRRRHAMLAGETPLPATRFYAGAPDFAVRRDKCWNKQTTFEDVKACDAGENRCFAECSDRL